MSLDLSSLWASDQTRRIDLNADVWVEIKEELDHGEEQAMQAAAMKGITRQQVQSAIDSGEEQQDVILMDSARLHFLKLAFYLVDWNLRDEQGRTITLPTRVDDRVRILKRLKPAVGTRISEAIDALREEKARESAPNAAEPATTSRSSSATAARSANGRTTPSGVETPTEATS